MSADEAQDILSSNLAGTEEFWDEAIIDTGASRTVVGEDRVRAIVQGLKGKVQIKKGPSECVFRFGNSGTLQSRYALCFSRKGQGWLRVEVVPVTLTLVLVRYWY